jgi:hypothetical protein
MTSRTLLSAGIAGLVACGGASQTPRPAPPTTTPAPVTTTQPAPPPAPAAPAVAPAKAASGDDELATMIEMDRAMCACHDAACVDKVTHDHADFMSAMSAKYGDDRATPSADVMRIGVHMKDCYTTATRGHRGVGIDGGPPDQPPPAPPTPAPAAVYVAGSIASCDAYFVAFERYMSCDKVPPQAREAAAQGIEQMKQGLAMLSDPGVPAEAQKAASDACAQATDALKESADAMGCPVDVPASAATPPKKPPKKPPHHHHKH